MIKKGSADMWWIIIGALIALVVMVVLLVLFTEKSGKVETGLSACETQGGICLTETEGCPANTVKTSVFDCGEARQCCLGSPKACNTDKDCGLNQICAPFASGRYCTKSIS